MSRKGREARNEVRFRDQNEWIEGMSDRFGDSGRMMTFVCECGDGECEDELHLTRQEYEQVRAIANRFVVKLNHENPEAEIVVTEGERFAVVDKIAELEMRIARETNPRAQRLEPRDPRIEEHR